MKALRILLASLALLLMSGTMQAQFGKRLGNAIENAAKNAAVRKAEQKTEEAVSKSIDKATDPNTYKDGENKDNKDKKKPSSKKQSGNEEEGEDGEEDDVQPQGKAAKQTKPALQSYTAYDFVPGDQIIFFDDFSQDAVGDFPDLWTTDGSGEVKTVNLAPGHWLQATTTGSTFALLKKLELPENFIFEFDYLPYAEEKDRGSNWYRESSIIFYQSDKEIDNGIYPGKQGVRLEFNNYRWVVLSYGGGQYGSPGNSDKNHVTDDINHIIMWVQKRRVRVYHAGAKVIDLPTILPQGATYNSFCFKNHSASLPYITNIKITTAAPDVRSKLLTEGKLVSYGIYFDSGKDVVKPESYGSVKVIADVLKENPDVRIRILGHTDTDGKADANLDLSKRRAAAVKNYLAKEFGIDAGRIETDGKGQTEPVAPNNTTEGKAKNRRVEFVKIN
ncbi:hypothetical protein FACS1894181_06250 [Bacteroidia bacterium]|nr:hypothetical protein FACS1894181_06250 [Bacteroidia bacterium]